MFNALLGSFVAWSLTAGARPGPWPAAAALALGGALLLSKGMRPTAAEIWGKVATNVFYIAMIIILAFGENGALCNVTHFTLPSVVTWVLVALSAVSALVSLLGYVPGFLKQLKENKAQNTAK